MCFICDGGTEDELELAVTSDIDRYGWHIVGVEADRHQRGWAYTVGITETQRHPELILMAPCCLDCAGATLNYLGDLIARGRRFTPGAGALDDAGRLVARFGAVHPRHWQAGVFASWTRHYDGKPWAPEPAALQVITLDARGRWKDDATNRRWRDQRLDRPPLLCPSPGRRSRRARRSR